MRNSNFLNNILNDLNFVKININFLNILIKCQKDRANYNKMEKSLNNEAIQTLIKLILIIQIACIYSLSLTMMIILR